MLYGRNFVLVIETEKLEVRMAIQAFLDQFKGNIPYQILDGKVLVIRDECPDLLFWLDVSNRDGVKNEGFNISVLGWAVYRQSQYDENDFPVAPVDICGVTKTVFNGRVLETTTDIDIRFLGLSDISEGIIEDMLTHPTIARRRRD